MGERVWNLERKFNLAAGAKQNQVELDVPGGTTVTALLKPFRLPPE